MNDKLNKVRELALGLRALIPEGNSVKIEFRGYHSLPVELTVFGVPSVAEGMELLRSLGVDKRHKQPYANNEVYTAIQGDADDVHVVAFCDGLPPSCKLEKVIERVPKSQTVTTGEFVEIERVKIICGGGKLEGIEI